MRAVKELAGWLWPAIAVFAVLAVLAVLSGPGR